MQSNIESFRVPEIPREQLLSWFQSITGVPLRNITQLHQKIMTLPAHIQSILPMVGLKFLERVGWNKDRHVDLLLSSSSMRSVNENCYPRLHVFYEALCSADCTVFQELAALAKTEEAFRGMIALIVSGHVILEKSQSKALIIRQLAQNIHVDKKPELLEIILKLLISYWFNRLIDLDSAVFLVQRQADEDDPSYLVSLHNLYNWMRIENNGFTIANNLKNLEKFGAKIRHIVTHFKRRGLTPHSTDLLSILQFGDNGLELALSIIDSGYQIKPQEIGTLLHWLREQIKSNPTLTRRFRDMYCNILPGLMRQYRIPISLRHTVVLLKVLDKCESEIGTIHSFFENRLQYQADSAEQNERCWYVLAFMIDHNIPFNASLEFFVKDFKCYRQLLNIVEKRTAQLERVSTIIHDFKNQRQKLRGIDALIAQGYSLTTDEIAEILRKKRYHFESLQNLYIFKHTVPVMSNISKLIMECNSQEIAEGLSFLAVRNFFNNPPQRELLDFIKIVFSSGPYAVSVSQLLINYRDSNVPFTTIRIKRLLEASTNSYWLLKNSEFLRMNLDNFPPTFLKRLLFPGLFNHFNLALSTHDHDLLYTKWLISSDVLLSTPLLYDFAKVLLQLIDSCANDDLSDMAVRILSHSKPKQLIDAYVFLKARGAYSEEFFNAITSESVNYPLSVAVGLQQCTEAGLQLPLEEIKLIFDTDSPEDAKDLARAVIFYYRVFANQPLGLDRITAFKSLDDYGQASSLVQAWHYQQEHLQQELPTDIQELALFGFFCSEIVDINEMGDMIRTVSQRESLRNVLINMENAGIPLTRTIYLNLIDDNQDDDNDEQDEEVLNERAETIIIENQNHWCQSFLRPLRELSPHNEHLFDMLKRYSSEKVIERGTDLTTLRSHVLTVVDFLRDNTHYMGLFDNIASVYNAGCVNQPVQGFMEISSWLFMAKQEYFEDKLQALKYRYALESVTTFVEESHEVGQMTKAEAANSLIKEIFMRLKAAGAIQDWPHVPQEACAFFESIQSFMDATTTHHFIHNIIVKVKNMSLEDLKEYVLSEGRGYHELWAALCFKNELDVITQEFQAAEQAIKDLITFKCELDAVVQDFVTKDGMTELFVRDYLLRDNIESIHMPEEELYQQLRSQRDIIQQNIATQKQQNPQWSLAEYSIEALYQGLKNLEYQRQQKIKEMSEYMTSVSLLDNIRNINLSVSTDCIEEGVVFSADSITELVFSENINDNEEQISKRRRIRK